LGYHERNRHREFGRDPARKSRLKFELNFPLSKNCLSHQGNRRNNDEVEPSRNFNLTDKSKDHQRSAVIATLEEVLAELDEKRHFLPALKIVEALEALGTEKTPD
tara:strand:- start:318 stop:632 length:315 start_codon:yes stop_codon:yes gene_type:complete